MLGMHCLDVLMDGLQIGKLERFGAIDANQMLLDDVLLEVIGMPMEASRRILFAVMAFIFPHVHVNTHVVMS